MHTQTHTHTPSLCPSHRSAVTELACDIAFVGTLSRVHGHLQRRLFAAVLRGDIAELRDEGAGEHGI